MPPIQAPPRPSGPGQKTKLRVGFFVSFPFHQEILRPIYDQLQGEFPCLITEDVQAIFQFRPHILFVADRFLPRYREQLPDTLIAYTRHGFISKNYAWGVFGESDFVCVSSPWVRDDCALRGWRPQMGYWVTGFVPMDKVLADRAANRKPALPAGFTTDGPTLLYAPTFNPLLNSIEMLGQNWIQRLRERYPRLNVIIKPHPHTEERGEGAMRILEDLAANHERTLLVPADANIYDLMPMADVMISDVSSVPFYFLAWDRPIILVNNPRRFEEPRFLDLKGPEWTWRDMAVEVAHADALPEAFQQAIEHPEHKADRRALYRERVFGNLLDGNGAARIAEKVRALANPQPKDRPWVEVVWNSARTMRRLQRLIPSPVSEQPSPAPVAAVPPTTRKFAIHLEKYPLLLKAVKEQPDLSKELGRLLGDALSQRPTAASTPAKSPQSPAPTAS